MFALTLLANSWFCWLVIPEDTLSGDGLSSGNHRFASGKGNGDRTFTVGNSCLNWGCPTISVGSGIRTFAAGGENLVYFR